MRRNYIFSILIIFGLSSFVYALTLLKTSLEELTRESDLIVHGTVEQVTCLWQDKDQGTINTFVTVRTLDYIKGSDESRVVVKQMGGQIGDWGDVIAGTPVLREGDEVILFLVNHKDSYQIHSIALGFFRVYLNDLGEKMVINDFRNVNLIDPATGQEVKEDKINPSFAIYPFKNQIKSYLSD